MSHAGSWELFLEEPCSHTVQDQEICCHEKFSNILSRGSLVLEGRSHCACETHIWVLGFMSYMFKQKMVSLVTSMSWHWRGGRKLGFLSCFKPKLYDSKARVCDLTSEDLDAHASTVIFWPYMFGKSLMYVELCSPKNSVQWILPNIYSHVIHTQIKVYDISIASDSSFMVLSN